jgi:hypothetical protein
MSNEKREKKTGWGGKREPSGRKNRPGGTEKICVSVSKQTWQAALEAWTGKASHLVDMLLSAYVKERESIKQEASI